MDRLPFVSKLKARSRKVGCIKVEGEESEAEVSEARACDAYRGGDSIVEGH